MAQRYENEQKQAYCERQEERYDRMSKYSLDPDNQRMYAARADEWGQRVEGYKKLNSKAENISEKPVETVEKSGGSGIIEPKSKAEKYEKFLKMGSGTESTNAQIENTNADTPITVEQIDNLKLRLKNIGVHGFDSKKLTTATVIDGFVKQLEHLHKGYNKMFFNISVVDLLKGDIAQVTPSGVLQLNTMYFNSSSAMDAVIKDFIAKKLLPKGANIKYIATHEWGHFISADDLNNPKSPMCVLFKRTKEKDFVSRNAEKNVYEYVADAIACNINNIPCKNSDKVIEYFLKGVV